MKDSSKKYISGAFGGCLGILLSHPFDTIRIRIQSNNHYSGILDCIKKSYYNNGIKSFYKGITPPIIGMAIEKSIVFGTYNYMNKYHNFNHFNSGLIAGFLCSIIVTPVEKIKINLQDIKKHNNSLSVIKDIYKNHGLLGFYKGWSITLFREIPGFGLYFSFYNFLEKKTINITNKKPNNFQVALYGGLSGAFAWVFIYPPDIIKTHMQNMSIQNKYKNTFHCISTLYKQNGIRTFYKGFNTAILRAIPLHAGVFLGFNICNNMLL